VVAGLAAGGGGSLRGVRAADKGGRGGKRGGVEQRRVSNMILDMASGGRAVLAS
jgi:hypothetical protein